MDKDIHAMFQQVFKRLDEIKADILTQTAREKMVDAEGICKLMKLSKKSLTRYRNLKLIPFYKIKGKVYFLESEVREALKKHYYGG